MKPLCNIIDDCTDKQAKQDLIKIREQLHTIYDKLEAAEAFMSMCADADVYENYYSVVNSLYEILYG